MSSPALTSTHLLQLAGTKSPPPPPQPSQNQNRSLHPNLYPIPKSNKPLDLTVAWTSSISHHCRRGQLREAASKFTQMRLSGVEPNHVTLITLLSACSAFPSDGESFGPLIHAYARKLGFDILDVMVGTALVDMYAKCGQVEKARLCFDALKVRNSVSWNTMVDGYMRNGEIECAIELFDEMPKRDAISWTVFIDGFVKKGHFEEGLELFREMQISKLQPDYVTIIVVISACANLGALGLGMWIHRYILKQDFRNNVRVSNSLIDMYSRCGCIELAHQVFLKMSKRTLVSWNSMIVSFASNGFAEQCLEYFELMQKEFEPDGVSFTGALTACSHAGFVEEGLRYFDLMKRKHKISPRIEHYGCLVDLYSRAGRLEDAFSVVQNMTMKPNEVVLGSLLAACSVHGDIELAERLSNYISHLDPFDDSNFVLLSNVYAGEGRWDGASKVRRRMKALGIQKKPGISSIEIECGVHEFAAGDKSHVESDHVYEMLDLLSYHLKLCGYVPADVYEYD
ncbi:pentatricopeptide repeat-containing protein At1g05750, chloroplastic [Euphorbia lathyris]|uniref:pentatricopeptide repeat-containing protein At1g05750, chloroplastic n=1 Tax=Euphorbia lathyris TaxID=212925 RepID=UPI0033135286